MKFYLKAVIVALFCLLSTNAFAQTRASEQPYVMIMPQTSYDLRKYLSENLLYPETARLLGIGGKVNVKFAVMPDGKIDSVLVIRSLGWGCDEEAIRVISTMPKWSPGKKDGVAVSVPYTQAISFSLDGGGGSTTPAEMPWKTFFKSSDMTVSFENAWHTLYRRQVDSAIMLAKNVLTSNLANPYPYWLIGRAELLSGNNTAALRDLQKAFDLAVQYDTFTVSGFKDILIRELATAMAAGKDYKAAISSIERTKDKYSYPDALGNCIKGLNDLNTIATLGESSLQQMVLSDATALRNYAWYRLAQLNAENGKYFNAALLFALTSNPKEGTEAWNSLLYDLSNLGSSRLGYVGPGNMNFPAPVAKHDKLIVQAFDPSASGDKLSVAGIAEAFTSYLADLSQHKEGFYYRYFQSLIEQVQKSSSEEEFVVSMKNSLLQWTPEGRFRSITSEWLKERK